MQLGGNIKGWKTGLEGCFWVNGGNIWLLTRARAIVPSYYVLLQQPVFHLAPTDFINFSIILHLSSGFNHQHLCEGVFFIMLQILMLKFLQE